MNNADVSRATCRIVDDAGPCLQEAVDKGCVLRLVLDPFCHKQALARLYEYEQGKDIKELFRKTSLEELHAASPRITDIRPESRMLRWLCEADPAGWGMILAADAPLDEILAHLRSLLLVKSDGGNVIFRFWDGSVLSRICTTLPEEIPALLGPVRRVLARTHSQEWACIDRDGDAFMKTPHQPRQPLPCPWYRVTERHEHAFHDQRPAILAHNIIESLLYEQTGSALPLPPTERLQPFVARHVGRGMELGLWKPEALELFVRCCLLRGESFPEVQPIPAPFSRSPVNEDMAIQTMSRICNHGGNHE